MRSFLPSEMDKPNLVKPLFIAALVVFGFLGAFLGWSLFAPIESAAIAYGEVGAEGKQKEIKHLEGGIISEILVKDGDKVVSGQVLIKLESTQALSSVDLITSRYHAALALMARLEAERDSLDTVEFPEILMKGEEKNITTILATQKSIFQARRDALYKQRNILNQRIAQYESEIKGLKGEISSQNEQLSYIKEEVSAYKQLENNGYTASKIRLLDAQKEHAGVRGGRSQNSASLARIKQNIVETELQISTLDVERLNEVVEQLREVQIELYDMDEKLRATRDVLFRTEIKAPIDGVIVGLQIHTVGGVVGSGEKLLSIVPSNERLIIEAKVDPQDIDVVRPGLKAHVSFSAFSSRTHLPVEGEVINVSADRFMDTRTGDAYYKAKVAITEDIEKALNGENLYPGMQAEVMIVTGSKTPMDFLLEPLIDSTNRAFRES